MQLTATGTESITFTLNGAPAGVSIDVDNKLVIAPTVAAGTYNFTITASNEAGNSDAQSFTLMVSAKIQVSVTNITLSKTATINTGKTTTLTATVAPSNATNKVVNRSTSNSKVATVANGAVKGTGAGGVAQQKI